MSGRLIRGGLGAGSTDTITPAAIQGLVTGSEPANNASQAVATVTDGLNLTTTYQLDPEGRLTRLTRPDNTFETYQLNSQGQVVQSTDFLGITTGYVYDTSSAGKGDLITTAYADA